MIRWFARSLALVLCMVFVGCESLEKHSFESFQPSKAQQAATVQSDRLAQQYADSVARLLERRGTGARVTRELTDSTLVVAGALAAAREPLGIAAKTVSQAAAGVIVLKELQGIFNARGRSEAFTDAAYLIRQAQSEYRQFNPNASTTQLTENGAILISRVDASLHAARKTLNGRMPGLLDLQQATQPMTKEGANRESSGAPQTMFTASGDTPGHAAVRAALQARLDEADKVRSTGTTQMSPTQIDALIAQREKDKEQRDIDRALGLPSRTEFNQSITAIDAKIPTAEKERIYTELFKKAGVSLKSPEFEGLSPTFNRQTLVEAYRVLPANRSAIFDGVEELKVKFPPQ